MRNGVSGSSARSLAAKLLGQLSERAGSLPSVRWIASLQPTDWGRPELHDLDLVILADNPPLTELLCTLPELISELPSKTPQADVFVFPTFRFQQLHLLSGSEPTLSVHLSIYKSIATMRTHEGHMLSSAIIDGFLTELGTAPTQKELASMGSPDALAENLHRLAQLWLETTVMSLTKSLPEPFRSADAEHKYAYITRIGASMLSPAHFLEGSHKEDALDPPLGGDLTPAALKAAQVLDTLFDH